MAIEVSYNAAGQTNDFAQNSHNSNGKNFQLVPQGRAFESILRVLADRLPGISKAGTGGHDAAKIFNEDGLFGTSVSLPASKKFLRVSSSENAPGTLSQGSMNRRPVGSANLPAKRQNERIESSSVEIKNAGNVPMSPGSASANGKVESSLFGTRNAQFVSATSDSGVNSTTIPVRQNVSTQDEFRLTNDGMQKMPAQRTGSNSPRGAVLYSMLQERPGSASTRAPVQIAISDLERGITIVARMAHLSAEQRKKLLPVLTATLAQYGMAHAEFILNGETVSTASRLRE